MMLRMLMPVVTRGLRSVVVSSVVLALVAIPAHAQVGYTPSESPFRDQKIGQTLSVLGGQLFLRRDPADVAPSPGPMFGARYDVGVGGPSALYVRYSMSPSERRSLLPSQPLATRLEATPSVTTHIVDLGLDIALTGRKTWRNLMPSVTGGVGIASDFQSADAGGYKFGSKFTVTYGAALRYIPPGRISYRLDVTNFYWQYQYPDAYFVPTSDQTAVLSDTRQRNAWRGNWGVTAGLSWQLFK
jgi:hypothetical protein